MLRKQVPIIRLSRQRTRSTRPQRQRRQTRLRFFRSRHKALVEGCRRRMAFEDVEWHRVVAWNGLGESTRRTKLKKGDHIYVEGTLVSSTFEKEFGKGKSKITVPFKAWQVKAHSIRKLNRAKKTQARRGEAPVEAKPGRRHPVLEVAISRKALGLDDEALYAFSFRLRSGRLPELMSEGSCRAVLPSSSRLDEGLIVLRY